MNCKNPNCDSDKFEIIRIFRNKKYTDAGWKSTRFYDTRLAICENCGQRYHFETTISRVFEYDKKKMRPLLIATEVHNFELFEEDEDDSVLH